MGTVLTYWWRILFRKEFGYGCFIRWAGGDNVVSVCVAILERGNNVDTMGNNRDDGGRWRVSVVLWNEKDLGRSSWNPTMPATWLPRFMVWRRRCDWPLIGLADARYLIDFWPKLQKRLVLKLWLTQLRNKHGSKFLKSKSLISF